MTELIRIWFLALCAGGIVGFVATAIRFRAYRGEVERKIGPVPIPAPLVAFAVAAAVIGSGVGEITGEWWTVRVLGVAFSLAAVILIPWTAAALGRLFIPGAAVLRSHELVTSGPFRWVRHPLLAAMLAFWLGAALGNLNWIMLVLLFPLLAAVLTSSRHEEELLGDRFGPEYELYQSRTGRFLPRMVGRRDMDLHRMNDDRPRT